MPAVRRRCPALTVLPMDTPFYRRCSAELLAMIKAAPCWTAPTEPLVEKASIDDFYVDCSAEVRHRHRHRSRPRAARATISQPPSTKRRRLSDGSSPWQPPEVDSQQYWSDDEPPAVSDGGNGSEFGGSDDELDNNNNSPAFSRRAVCPTYFDAVSVYCPPSDASKGPQPYTPDPWIAGPGRDSGPALTVCSIAHELRDHVRRASGGMLGRRGRQRQPSASASAGQAEQSWPWASRRRRTYARSTPSRTTYAAKPSGIRNP